MPLKDGYRLSPSPTKAGRLLTPEESFLSKTQTSIVRPSEVEVKAGSPSVKAVQFLWSWAVPRPLCQLRADSNLQLAFRVQLCTPTPTTALTAILPGGLWVGSTASIPEKWRGTLLEKDGSGPPVSGLGGQFQAWAGIQALGLLPFYLQKSGNARAALSHGTRRWVDRPPQPG